MAPARTGILASSNGKGVLMATVVGTRVIRSDGKDKVTGVGRYAADLTLTGMAHSWP